MGIVFLCIAFLVGVLVFVLALRGGWHWTLAVFTGLLPVGLTLLGGILGLILSFFVASAVYKFTA